MNQSRCPHVGPKTMYFVKVHTGATWRIRLNDPVRGGDAALHQITLTTCHHSTPVRGAVNLMTASVCRCARVCLLSVCLRAYLRSISSRPVFTNFVVSHRRVSVLLWWRFSGSSGLRMTSSLQRNRRQNRRIVKRPQHEFDTQAYTEAVPLGVSTGSGRGTTDCCYAPAVGRAH